jgi:toxin ParE1/3/4
VAVRVIWTHRARADLLDIYELIGLEQPAAAERYFDRIEGLADLLRDHPRMGPRRTDIAPALRMLVERPYVLLYRTEPDADEGGIDAVEIVRVVDGRRDLRRLF